MKAILGDKSDTQAAVELRATLQEEYKSVTMSEWDRHQIVKLLGKKWLLGYVRIAGLHSYPNVMATRVSK